MIPTQSTPQQQQSLQQPTTPQPLKPPPPPASIASSSSQQLLPSLPALLNLPIISSSNNLPTIIPTIPASLGFEQLQEKPSLSGVTPSNLVEFIGYPTENQNQNISNQNILHFFQMNMAYQKLLHQQQFLDLQLRSQQILSSNSFNPTNCMFLPPNPLQLTTSSNMLLPQPLLQQHFSQLQQYQQPAFLQLQQQQQQLQINQEQQTFPRLEGKSSPQSNQTLQKSIHPASSSLESNQRNILILVPPTPTTEQQVIAKTLNQISNENTQIFPCSSALTATTVSNTPPETKDSVSTCSIKEGVITEPSQNLPVNQNSINSERQQQQQQSQVMPINQPQLVLPQLQQFHRFDGSVSEMESQLNQIINSIPTHQAVNLFLVNIPQRTHEITQFENRFVNSMKARQSKDKRNPNALYMTRFHNLTRLLMYNIIQLFTFETLSGQLNLHPYIATSLEQICRKLKQHARSTCNGQFKTDFYTHSHYNGLFLLLNTHTIPHLNKQVKDVEIHQQVYEAQLTSSEALAIKRANFFKVLAHEILMKCSESNSDNKSNHFNIGDDSRRIYFRRALQGITKLTQGQIVHRF